MNQKVKTLSAETGEPLLRYLVHVPPKMEPDGAVNWPLIIFLHGAGERGPDIHKLLIYGIPKIVEADGNFPFITVSPQCPKDDWWPLIIDRLDLLWDEILANFPVDQSRVYLTGLSMGAFGSWAWAEIDPHRFAAMAVVCGGSPWKDFPSRVCALKDLPIWAFHGAQDDLVPISESEILVDALRKCGGSIRFTVYPDMGHEAWTPTYSNPALYRWMLENQRLVEDRA